MLKCPECEAQLSQSDIRKGECRHCGCEVAGQQTIDGPAMAGRPDATVDDKGDATHTLDFPQPTESGDHRDPANTIQSSPTEGGDSFVEPGPMETLVGDDSVAGIDSAGGPAETFDSTLAPDDSAAVSQHIQATWAPSVGDSRPNMTIKTLGDAGKRGFVPTREVSWRHCRPLGRFLNLGSADSAPDLHQ